MKETETIILRRVGGFYHAFDEDAIVLFYLCHYKINNGRSGFPVGSLGKVKSLLEMEKISYLLKISEDVEEEMDFKEENRYQEIYELGEVAYREYHKKEKITERIFCLEEEKVDQVLQFVQKLI